MGAKRGAVLAAKTSASDRKSTLVVTTCSAGKRCRRPLSVNSLPRGSLKVTADAWVRKLAKERDLQPASNVYKGRAFQIASIAANVLAADLSILSAGLGFVRSETSIPGYDLTIRPKGPGSVVRKVTDGMDPSRWWVAVKRGPFSSNFTRDARGRERVFVCLSRAYATMVEKDLIAVSKFEGVELRIFGLSIKSHLDEVLRPYVMPYDERLDGLGRPGTRVDFPQRALLDFVTSVAPESSGNLDADKRAVLARLAPVAVVRPVREQRRLPDEDIRQRIANLIPRIGPASTRILRHLRDVEGVSCEQSRFVGLFRSVKQESSQ